MSKAVRKLTQEKADEIKVLVANGEKRKDVAKTYGVSVQTISDIVNGHLWRTPGTPKPVRGPGGRPRRTDPFPLCECGCGKPVKSYGVRYLEKHYQRSEKNRKISSKHLGTVPYTDAEFIAATLANCVEVDLGYHTPCQLWAGSFDPKTGYVPATRGRRYSSRSRFILEAHLGRELRRDECADHLCGHTGKRDARRCMNPAHLSPASYAENLRNSPKTRLTRGIADEIVRLWEAGKSSAEIGRMFGISQSHAWGIATGRRWTAA